MATEVVPGEKNYPEWNKREIPEYGKNKVIATVKEISNFAPSFAKKREEWQPWKQRECDAGFLPGQQLVFEEGMKLAKGKIYCFSAIYWSIPWIWGVTFDCWFPWLHRPATGLVIEEQGPGLYAEGKMLGMCCDLEHTVIFEIKKIKD